MALNILSLNKFERKHERHPNYIAEAELNGMEVKFEIYTNARLFLDASSEIYATDWNYSRMNGNLYLRVESITRFNVMNNKEIEREFRRIINGNGHI